MGSAGHIACRWVMAGSLVFGGPAIVQLTAQAPFPKEDPRAVVFADVEKGVMTGTVAQFSRHLASQVYMQLREGESGTYSANQAYYVLQIFFRAHKSLGAKLSSFGGSETNPYATGRATFVANGIRQETQMYVSLSRHGDRWMITHLSVY